MSNKTAAKRRIKRQNKVPQHIWIARRQAKAALMRRLARLEELAAS